MYKRILPVFLACMILLCGIQDVLAEGEISLEGALEMDKGNILLYGARRDGTGENAWCACVNDQGKILWEKMALFSRYPD